MVLAIISGALMPPPQSAQAVTAPETPSAQQEENSDETPSQPDARTIKDAQLRWTISEQLQKRPPVGGVNYLSAGISDGKKRTYSNSAGNVVSDLM